jgi:hypothetical protein
VEAGVVTAAAGRRRGGWAEPSGAALLKVLGCWLLLSLAGVQPLSAQEQRDTAEARRAREAALLLEARRHWQQLRARDEPVPIPLEAVTPGAAPAGAERPRALPAQPSGEGIETLPRDTLMERLLQLEGYVATEYLGAGVRFDRDTGELVLEGRAEVVRGGQRMSADSLLVYNANTAVVCGYGMPVLSEPGASPVLSDQVCFNVDRQIGVAMGARTQFTEGATWHVHGERVYTLGNERLYGANTDFTSCELDVPHYHFTAGEFKYVHGDLMVARNVTINFGDVPIFWLPFMVQSLKEGRRSGLLTPRFGINDVARTSPGYSRRISNLGFYWAASDYTGAKVALDWFSDNWLAVASEFQYRVRSRFLEGGVSMRQFWPERGGRQLTLATRHSWRPDERSQVMADVNYASSSAFVQRNTFDPRELNRDLTSNVGYSRRLDWGSLTLGGRRRQSLVDERVELSLPSVGLSLSPVTLYAPGAAAGLLPEVTWQGSASFTPTSVRVDATQPGPQARNTGNWTGNLNSSLNVGRLGWSQSFSARENVLHARAPLDTVPELPREIQQSYDWSSSLNYQLRLVGTSTLTPAVSMRGQARRDPTDWSLVQAPVRADMRANMKLDVFGFWPGVGPFAGMRHMVTPNVTYHYSPAVRGDERQQRVFGAQEIREQNRVEIGLTQVFEAKYRERDDTAVGAPAAVDTAEVTDGEPRRLPQARKIQLLRLGASTVAYDFVRARETGVGFVTPSVSYNMTSDLVQGLNLNMTQTLFRQDPTAPGDPAARTFEPRITSVNASFSINEQFLLFRLLGRLRGEDPQVDRHPPVQELPDTAQTIPGHARHDPGAVSLGAGALQAGPLGGATRRVGAFNAGVSYSLVRRPDATTGGFEAAEQALRSNMSFQPTQNWSVQWSTGYSVTDNRFQEHVLSLIRDLDCWQASFNFMRAPNGNFSFQFFVELRANRDLKLEYQQRGQAGGDLP